MRRIEIAARATGASYFERVDAKNQRVPLGSREHLRQRLFDWRFTHFQQLYCHELEFRPKATQRDCGPLNPAAGQGRSNYCFSAKMKHTSRLGKITRREVMSQQSNPSRSSSAAKSSRSIKAKVASSGKCSIARPLPSKNKFEFLTSRFAWVTEKTAQMSARLKRQPSRENLLHSSSSRRASAEDICLIMVALP